MALICAYHLNDKQPLLSCHVLCFVTFESESRNEFARCLVRFIASFNPVTEEIKSVLNFAQFNFQHHLHLRKQYLKNCKGNR